MSNWSAGTIKQYNSALRRWADYCRYHAIDRQRPPRPRYSDIWDVSVVLSYLVSLGPNRGLSLKDLTLKTVMLVALVAPKRASELAALSLNSVQVGADTWVFTLDYVNTNRGWGKAHTAVIRAYPEDRILCPLTAVKDYTLRTLLYRHKTHSLFLSFHRPHNSVTSTTISRWLRLLLSRAGIDDRFKAHSTRAASTTASRKHGLSSKAIMEAANWAPNGSTFERFYYKGSDENSFQASVLSSTRCVEEAVEAKREREQEKGRKAGVKAFEGLKEQEVPPCTKVAPQNAVVQH
ncbi:site-specific recombinase, phage integrase family [Oesophagostomum dentatum]|uniref:Site-specific recombinase, phage integrase family n=1 Tax=Oesophagostomum dentatum TaxID=61180 RepID=A0A0B1SAV7_OESDE|nr:site-specific recombinase, phage integrase family [Oesophagostomum dentatum]